MRLSVLGIYDLENMSWTEVDEQQQASMPCFNWGHHPYFVFGDHGRLYHAGKIEKSAIQFYYTLDDTKLTLTPFATDGELFLYLIANSLYNDTEDELIERRANNDWYRRVVTISNDGEVTLVANLDGFVVSDGVIAGDFLYFTSFDDKSRSTRFDVLSINLTLDDPRQEPVLIRDDYVTSKLYQYQGQVLYHDLKQQILYNDEITINLDRDTQDIMIDDEVDMLAMKCETPEGPLELVFVDIPTGKVLGTYLNAINYVREGMDITIYGHGFIEHLSLAEEE